MGTTDVGGAGDERGIVGHEEKILVSVRLRPLNEKEIARNDVCDWECVNESTIVFKNRNLPVLDRSMYPTAYTFDRVFGSACATKQVYEEGAKEVALSVVSGINSTLFAYGQTSSGKTYTMTGITEYTIADIFCYIEKHMEREYHLKLSAMEIYNESVRDLLSVDSSPLRLLDDPERGTVVEKLIEEPIRDWNHVMELLSICEAQRQIGETALNEASSRSHQIIRLTIESSPREFLSKESSSTLVASVNFVDLAGSERASQSLSAGTRLKEGCHINRSLLTLGTVIRKLGKGRNGHIPFRDSKLTRILQSSLGGNARTAIICTMSPARSHVEQSRNTLLFASCAKEVITNAQVNVIMSDKALVKHLQRELARLESELRSPGSTFAMHYSALVRDKDLQIEKLEKEVMDLTMQRDFAKTQVQDLLRLVGEDGDSMVGLNDYPHLRIRKSPEYEYEISERSLSADPHSLDIGVRMFDRATYAYVQNADNPHDHYVRFSDYEENYQLNGNSPHILVSTSQFIRSNSEQSWNGIEEQTDGISEDLCKEVRCIETEESSTDHLSESNVSCPVENGTDKELVSLPIKEDKELNSIVPFIAPSPEKLSPWPSANYTCSSGTFKLTKSRSCKASLMTSPRSLWFSKVENNENTPPNGFEKDFTGRPEGIQRKLSELKYEADTESKQAGSMDRVWSKSSQSSVGTAAAIELEALKDKTSSDENISRVNACETQMEEEVALQKEEQVVQCPVQTVEVKSEESFKNVKDVGLDPIEDDSNSLSDWALEFKRIQREIIKLWDDCNVSLVHRTYFFLLFKGDSSDSIYMEVELRRLSFLKDTFSRGNKTMDRGRALSPASSMKALCREREKLARQMLRRLSEQDRESLYLKWGIKINSKNRRLQLAYCLWTNTEDMDHIANSAFLVAKLVGIVEPGQVPKEMFGLNFAPQLQKDRFYSLKQSVASLL